MRMTRDRLAARDDKAKRAAMKAPTEAQELSMALGWVREWYPDISIGKVEGVGFAVTIKKRYGAALITVVHEINCNHVEAAIVEAVHIARTATDATRMPF